MKGFSRPPLTASLFRIKYSTKKVLLKNTYKKDLSQNLYGNKLIKIQFLTKTVLLKAFIKMHRFQLIDQKLNSNYAEKHYTVPGKK